MFELGIRRPSAHVLDTAKELMRGEPFRVKGEGGRALARRVLLEPQRLIVQAVGTDDHRRRYVGRLEQASPRRNQLAVAGEDDGRRRRRRDDMLLTCRPPS